jgi:cellulose synthase/poly-beta-1,6-N-acetylglucosamine synthase-like glycosyltransferase
MVSTSAQISVIIAVYNRLDFLELLLKSLDIQTFKNFEVIIAEDNNSEDMKKFIEEERKKHLFLIKHVSQQDKGFRKNKILNKAIKSSNTDFIVFLDGDVILHHRFLEEYYKNRSEGVCLFSKRVLLNSRLTNRILKTKNFKALSFLRILVNGCKHLEEGIYFPFKFNFINRRTFVIGSNFGLFKDEIYKINGFDEDYERPTFGEDTDLQWRLSEIGIKFKSLRNLAIQYHLFHGRENRTENHNKNEKLYNQKKKEGNIFCINGLIKNE